MLNINKIKRIRKAQSGFSFSYLPNLQLNSDFLLNSKLLQQLMPLLELNLPKLQVPTYLSNTLSQPTSQTNPIQQAGNMFEPIGTKLGNIMKKGKGVIGQLNRASTIANNLMLANNIAGSKVDNKVSANIDVLSKTGGSYMGTVKDINKGVNNSNKNFGLINFGKKRRAENFNRIAGLRLRHLADITNEAQDQKDSITDYNLYNYGLQLNGGIDPRYVKLGGTLEWRPIITDIPWKPIITDCVVMKQGGELEAPKIEETNLKNIIPEGALHKNKHHMDNDENITKKGIPVIDNEGEQLAEIELNEIIFTLEVTKKLEELYDKYRDYEHSNKEKDEVAIEAGKLLVKEILFNTEDRTGLLKTVE